MRLKKTFVRFFTLLFIAVFISCNENITKEKADSKGAHRGQNFEKQDYLSNKDFDTIIDNKQVKLYWIENEKIKAAFTNYGARIIGLWVPDTNGKFTDVVTGMNTIDAYTESTEPYFGATIGRVGNRIAKGKFTLNGEEYTIPTNNDDNTLHGGNKGFQDIVWSAEKKNNNTLVFHYTSPHMEGGFPGNLDVKVTYSLTSERALRIEYEAVTDQATPVNLTNHAFFNLNGEGSGRILEHKLQIYADKYTPVRDGLIPSGELKAVENTPFDFTEPYTIGERIKTKNEQLEYGGGYDHNFVLNKKRVKAMNHAATITGNESGIVMDIYTEEPGLQFYSGNFMQSKNIFKSGAKDDYRTAFALETQHFPDAPNQPTFPSIILNPGEKYQTVSEYKFTHNKR